MNFESSFFLYNNNTSADPWKHSGGHKSYIVIFKILWSKTTEENAQKILFLYILITSLQFVDNDCWALSVQIMIRSSKNIKYTF